MVVLVLKWNMRKGRLPMSASVFAIIKSLQQNLTRNIARGAWTSYWILRCNTLWQFRTKGLQNDLDSEMCSGEAWRLEFGSPQPTQKSPGMLMCTWNINAMEAKMERPPRAPWAASIVESVISGAVRGSTLKKKKMWNDWDTQHWTLFSTYAHIHLHMCIHTCTHIYACTHNGTSTHTNTFAHTYIYHKNLRQNSIWRRHLKKIK